MATKNSTILSKVWLEASNDFQQRVPNPTINGMFATTEAIFDPYNNDLYNEFTHLLNGIMNTYVEGKRFLNPLRELKKPMSTFGNSERHIAVQYMQAHSYKFDDETVWKNEPPQYIEWFYTVNRKDVYTFSFARNEVMRAFSSDGYGFNELLARTLDQQISSDEYDEMNIMLEQIAIADKKWRDADGNGGLYRYHVSAIPTDDATGKELLTGIRAMAGRIKFPSVLYNNIPVPVFTSNEEMILYITPEVKASLDVNTLASVFHLDKADIQYRIIEVPYIPIENAIAVLTDKDFIHARDVVYGVYPAPFNAAALSDKYYLHHQSIIAANPACPVIVFTTDEATNIPTVTIERSALAFNPASAEVAAGDSVKLALELSGTVDPATPPIAVEPEAAIFTVECEGKQLNSRTYVDYAGVLHTQKSLDVGDTLTVTAKYVDDEELTATATVTIIEPEDIGAKKSNTEVAPYTTWNKEYDTVAEDETVNP